MAFVLVSPAIVCAKGDPPTAQQISAILKRQSQAIISEDRQGFKCGTQE